MEAVKPKPPKTEWYVQRRRGRNKWAVIKNGNKRASYICNTDKEAIELADSLSRGKMYRGCKVDICDPDGNVVRSKLTFKQMEEADEDGACHLCGRW